jgi:hypothetical protein
MPKAVFHASPEDEKEEHVPKEMQPPSVQKHGNKDGNKETCHAQVRESVAGDVTGRDDPIQGNQTVDAAALTQLKEKDPCIRDDEGKSKSPKGASPDVVGEREGNHNKVEESSKIAGSRTKNQEAGIKKQEGKGQDSS